MAKTAGLPNTDRGRLVRKLPNSQNEEGVSYIEADICFLAFKNRGLSKKKVSLLRTSVAMPFSDYHRSTGGMLWWLRVSPVFGGRTIYVPVAGSSKPQDGPRRIHRMAAGCVLGTLGKNPTDVSSAFPSMLFAPRESGRCDSARAVSDTREGETGRKPSPAAEAALFCCGIRRHFPSEPRKMLPPRYRARLRTTRAVPAGASSPLPAR